MAENDLQVFLDGFEKIKPLVIFFAKASENQVSFKDRIILDKWFDNLCVVYSGANESDRIQIRNFFREDERAWALLCYVDKTLTRCVSSNAAKLLNKSLLILCIQNQSSDFREFDLRVEQAWSLATQTWGTAGQIFGNAVQFADSCPPASRNWSTLECLKHWQNRKM